MNNSKLDVFGIESAIIIPSLIGCHSINEASACFDIADSRMIFILVRPSSETAVRAFLRETEYTL